MKTATYNLLIFLLGKLTEKSSMAGFAAVTVGAFVGTQYQPLIAKIVAAVCAIAGAVLVILSDAQVKAIVTASPAPRDPPTVPKDQPPGNRQPPVP